MGALVWVFVHVEICVWCLFVWVYNYVCEYIYLYIEELRVTTEELISPDFALRAF